MTGVEPGFRSSREVESEVNSRFSRLRSFSYICQILAHLQLRHEHAVPIHPINPHFRHPTQRQPRARTRKRETILTKRTRTRHRAVTRAWRHTQHSAHAEYLSLSAVRPKRARRALALSRAETERDTTRYLSPLTYEQRRRDRSEIVAVHGSHSPSPIVSGGSEAHTRRCRRGGALRTSSASYTTPRTSLLATVARVHQVLRRGLTRVSPLTRRCSRGRT